MIQAPMATDVDWEEQARRMVKRYGKEEAIKRCREYRDLNSYGTASYSFHNAVLKELLRLQ